AKANPGKLNMGAGTITSRLGALLFAKRAGIDVQLVPFKGSAEIGQAVLAGTGGFFLGSTRLSLSLVPARPYSPPSQYTNPPRAGRSRALPKTPTRPPPLRPDGRGLAGARHLPGPDKSPPWAPLVAPAGTSAAIVDKIHREVASIYADAAMIAKLEKLGILATASSAPAEFDAFIRSETERWSKVFKDTGNIKLD